ncbi:XRE family transcriptional regulator, partial [Vibrio metschnikovii]
MSIVNRMISRRTQLSANELKIADWILAHPQQASVMTSLQLAEQVRASQSSIIKFAQKWALKVTVLLSIAGRRAQSLGKQALESNACVQQQLFLLVIHCAVTAQKLVQSKNG